ncbi:hypothetical protein [Janthinobacterium sp. MDT1-19]|uniref:hypothetical protein n=1 Tax=Janthinobacterium sp. MDT1-19 TaxID=1259339 RepID=UPI003F25C35C
MELIKSFIGIIILTTFTSVAYAQVAGADADFNKADRERVKKQSEEQAKRQQCMRDCDTVFKGQYSACGVMAAPTCSLNIDKNKAQCYQKCK